MKNKKRDGKFELRLMFILVLIVLALAFIIAPSLIYIYNSTTSDGFFNKTEATTLGVRNNAPVLFMDFNSAPEVPLGAYNKSTGTYVKDGSVYNSFGTISGSNETSPWSLGNFSNALQFDGSNDYVDTSFTSITSYPITMSAWYKSNGTGSNGIIVQLADKDVANQWISLAESSGTGGFHIFNYNVSTNLLYSGVAVNTNWHHVVGVWVNATNRSIYVDGIYRNSTTTYSDPTLVLDRFSMGRSGDSTPDSYSKGTIDEVMIFNRSLSSAEINDLYLNQSANIDGVLTTDASLVSYWKLNETSGNFTRDELGRNNGSLTNYALTSPNYASTGGYDGSGAYQFDGVDDVMTATLSSALTTYSVSAWIKNSTATSWSHVVWSSNGTNYTNALVSNPVQKPVNISSTAVKIGIQGATYFNGTIDQVQVYNRVLDSSEILALYNGTLNNSNYIGKYNLIGDYKSSVFYNSTSTYWNTTLSIADTYSSRTGIVNNKNEINLSEPSLVSYWKLDGNTLDAQGRNNGTAIGGVNNASGLSSGAMRFDGVDDYVNISNSSSLKPTSAISYGGWFMIKSSAALNVLMEKGNSNNAGYILFTTTNPKFCFLLKTSGGYSSGSSTTNLALNTWYHAFITYNSTTPNIYINGLPETIVAGTGCNVNTATGTITQDNNNTFIGSRLGTSLFANSIIDEVLIYNKSLSASEITSLYKSGLSQHANTNVTLQTRTANTYNITDPNLVSFWSFNNDNSSDAFDELGRNNGTYIGNALSNSSSGFVGNGAYFDGVNDYILIPHTSSINLDGYTQSYTFSLWVMSSSTSSLRIVEKYNGVPTKYPISLQCGAGTCGAYIYDGTNVPGVLYGSIMNSKWRHLVFVVDNPTDKVYGYLDGVLVGSATNTVTSTTATTANLTIGNSIDLSKDYTGFVDELRIYNRSLTASEVLDLYNLGATHISDWGAWSSEQTCYDNETQIKTENGWKLFSELSGDEKVATLNPETKEIEYNLPYAYQTYDAPEFMYKIKTYSGELIVSPEHKVYSSYSLYSNFYNNSGLIKAVLSILLIIIGLFGLLKFGLWRKKK